MATDAAPKPARPPLPVGEALPRPRLSATILGMRHTPFSRFSACGRQRSVTPGACGRQSSVSRYVHVALLFISHFFLGTFVAVWATYQYEQSRWLSSLNEQQGRQLLSLRETLLSSQTPVRSTPQSLERDLLRQQSVRREAPADALPILDLRMASDRALLARFYRNANDSAAAAEQTEAARSLLQQLGWRDISNPSLEQLADRRLRSLDRKDVR